MYVKLMSNIKQVFQGKMKDCAITSSHITYIAEIHSSHITYIAEIHSFKMKRIYLYQKIFSTWIYIDIILLVYNYELFLFHNFSLHFF